MAQSRRARTHHEALVRDHLRQGVAKHPERKAALRDRPPASSSTPSTRPSPEPDGLRRAGRRARRAAVHARRPAHDVPRAASGRCASTRASPRPRSRTTATAPCSSRGRRASPSPSTCRPRSATTPTTRSRAARSGRVGVSIAHLGDMETLLDGIPLEKVSHLDDDQLDGDRAAVDARRRREEARRRSGGAARHRPERHVQGVHRARHAAPAACARRSRLVVDVIEYATRHLPTLQPDLASAATTSARRARRPCEEVAFTLADARRLRRGGAASAASTSTRSRRASRSSSTRTTTSSRRSRSSAPPAACGSASCASASARKDPRSRMLRFHTQTAGSTLQARQVDVNVVRVTLQALAAVLGGTQSLHTNSRDEALSLPSEAAAVLALRTQQVHRARERRRPT